MVNEQSIILQVENISFSYPGSHPVFSGLSFSLRMRQRTVLFGSNGVGKSTLLFTILGLHKPTTGEIYFRGEKLSTIPEDKLRQCLAYIFQNPDDQVFAPTVEEDILFGPTQFNYSKEAAAEKLEEVVSLLQIEHLLKRNPRHLSYGEKRRVALAGVLILDPEVIFFDEPLAFLDPLGRQLFMHILSKLEAQGKSLFIVTHDLNFAGEWGERFLVLENGKLQTDGGREILRQGLQVFNGLRPLPAEIFHEYLPCERLPLSTAQAREFLTASKLSRENGVDKNRF